VHGHGGYGAYGRPGAYAGAPDDDDDAMLDAAAEDAVSEAQRQARKEAIRRLGRDGFLLLLTSAARARRLLTPATLTIAGAAVLATAVYPKASRYLRDKLSRRAGGVGALQGGSLSPLLANIYLHEFDRAMMRAGLRLVRYADDWIICCRDEQSAHAAMELAARELHRLKLRLNPEKTRVTRFDQDLEFLGYRFHPHLIAAAPAPEDERTPLADWWRNAAGKLRQGPAQIRPAASDAAGRAKARTREGWARLKTLAQHFRKGDEKE
ncbi:MAG: reverse transcriptase domain-containing protein, partial [Blastocatellia bacterium]